MANKIIDDFLAEYDTENNALNTPSEKAVEKPDMTFINNFLNEYDSQSQQPNTSPQSIQPALSTPALTQKRPALSKGLDDYQIIGEKPKTQAIEYTPEQLKNGPSAVDIFYGGAKQIIDDAGYYGNKLKEGNENYWTNVMTGIEAVNSSDYLPTGDLIEKSGLPKLTKNYRKYQKSDTTAGKEDEKKSWMQRQVGNTIQMIPGMAAAESSKLSGDNNPIDIKPLQIPDNKDVKPPEKSIDSINAKGDS